MHSSQPITSFFRNFLVRVGNGGRDFFQWQKCYHISYKLSLSALSTLFFSICKGPISGLCHQVGQCPYGQEYLGEKCQDGYIFLSSDLIKILCKNHWVDILLVLHGSFSNSSTMEQSFVVGSFSNFSTMEQSFCCRVCPSLAEWSIISLISTY